MTRVRHDSVLFVHEIHSLHGDNGAALEALLRDRWCPALARDDTARLVWCVRSMPGAIGYPELITLTAVDGATALNDLMTRVRSGDLRDDYAALDDIRTTVTTRLMKPLNFSPLAIDLAAMPTTPVDRGRSEMYIHDTVPPRPGMQRRYETAMADFYMKTIEVEGMVIRNWAGLETIAGGGAVPENLMITHIGTARAGADLLMMDIPRSAFEPGQWMCEALLLRDTWTSRLVRTVPWSPID